MRPSIGQTLPSLAMGGLSVTGLFLVSLVAAPVVLSLGVLEGLKRLIDARPWRGVTLL